MDFYEITSSNNYIAVIGENLQDEKIKALFDGEIIEEDDDD